MSPLQEFEQAKSDFAAEVERAVLGPGWRFGVCVVRPDGLIMQPVHRSPASAASLDRAEFLRFAAEVAAEAARLRGQQLELGL